MPEAASASLSLVASVFASWLAASTIDFEGLPRYSIQPIGAAFSIWSVIFGFSVAHAATTLASSESAESAWALTAAYACCVAWAYTVRRRRTVASAGALIAALACAAAASALASGAHWVFQVASDLLASWLAVAALLSVVASTPRAARLDSAWSLLAVAAGMATVAVAARRPALCVGIGWACALQTEGAPLHVAGATTAFLGACGALARRLA